MATGVSVAVHLTPPAPDQVAGRTLVLIDTLRATTTMTTLVQSGVSAIYACPSIEAARELAGRLRGSRLCGEVEGERPEGFDFGNSPTEFEALDVSGWKVVQVTTNGTPALQLAIDARRTLACCLRNRSAVAAALAGEPAIAIVCGGEEGGMAASLEDTYTAGALVEELCIRISELRLSAGARLARLVFRAYDSSLAAFPESQHAADLQARGFAADLAYAAELDVERVVPRAVVGAEGQVIVSS